MYDNVLGVKTRGTPQTKTATPTLLLVPLIHNSAEKHDGTNENFTRFRENNAMLKTRPIRADTRRSATSIDIRLQEYVTDCETDKVGRC